ncbi:MAG: class I SAM-dependent methyltransferase [Ignavibacteriaceae bacterium]|nr:class I SAM-dependent methyltransferase [Ignavibacteriaceae bacterium]
MNDFWNKKFSTDEYIYGTKPNEFLKDQLSKLKPAKILFVGEGEGRNAVYAAKIGWQVDAIDSSDVAMNKALSLAVQNNVSINYQLADIQSYDFPENYYDAVGIIFLHVNENLGERDRLYQKLTASLKKNGTIIVELFSKNQLGKKSGGPQDVSMLCSIDQIKKSFSTLKHKLLKEENIYLSEGNSHVGEASVIRYVGVK